MNSFEKGVVFAPSTVVDYSAGNVVSREILRNNAGTLTLFAFDAGQGLSEHTAPFDATLTILDGEGISAIFLVPFDIFHDHFAFFVLVEVVFFDFFAVFRVDGSLRRIVVEEAHKGTVGNKGHDAVCFILTHFETSNPSHNNEDGNAKISVEMTFERKENARSKFEEGVDSSHSRK